MMPSMVLGLFLYHSPDSDGGMGNKIQRTVPDGWWCGGLVVLVVGGVVVVLMWLWCGGSCGVYGGVEELIVVLLVWSW